MKEFINTFKLYQKHPEARIADEEIQTLIDEFLVNLKALQKRYQNAGANDSHSRDAVADHLMDRL
jgi:hypothetical protein